MNNSPTASTTLYSHDKYYTDVNVGNHNLVLDEPESAGGTDKGPNPVETALSALASCTAMTVKMYLQHKGWSHGDIKVNIYFENMRVSKETELSEEEQQFVIGARLRRIHKEIFVGGDFDEKQYKRMEKISKKCPVNQMMMGSCLISDEVGGL